MQETPLKPDETRALLDALTRIAAALELVAPPPEPPYDFGRALMHRYDADARAFAAPDFPLPLQLLVGIERQREALTATLRRFAEGAGANPALLKNARVTGKRSRVKAAMTALAPNAPRIRLAEIGREAVKNLSELFATLQTPAERFVILCDDLSFEVGAAAAEEAISVSDRFGLWLGFPPLEAKALRWAHQRGGRSGRTVVQFIRELAGEQGRASPFRPLSGRRDVGGDEVQRQHGGVLHAAHHNAALHVGDEADRQ